MTAQSDFFGPRCLPSVLADLFLGYALWAWVRKNSSEGYFAEVANRAARAQA